MSRRASLPGADELFRRTGGEPAAPAERRREGGRAAISQQGKKSTSLPDDISTEQRPEPGASESDARRAPKHAEKVTFYCTATDLVALERARLTLRAEHGVAVDRGRIVRAALAYVLEDFEARGGDSILARTIRVD